MQRAVLYLRVSTLDQVPGTQRLDLVELARQTGAKIALRGDTLAISGNTEAVARAIPIAQRMIDTAKQQLPLTADDVLRMSIEGPRGGDGNGNGVDSETRIVLPGVRKIIQAKKKSGGNGHVM